jgi:hypothetical protein
MHMPEPYTAPDRELVYSFLRELFADPQTTLKCSSSTIIDGELKQTGKRVWRIIVEGTAGDLVSNPTPEVGEVVTAGSLRQQQAAARYLEHAQTPDGKLVVAQQRSQDGDLVVITTRASLVAVTSELAYERAVKVVQDLPLPSGFKREFFEIRQHITNGHPGTALLEVIDKQEKSSPPIGLQNNPYAKITIHE